MTETLRHRGSLAPAVGLMVALLVSVSPALAAKPAGVGADASNGNNEGTVMVVNAETGIAAAGNDPHVCTFYLEFSGAPTGETGEWTIVDWPPTGDGTVMASGTYAIDITGSDTTDVLALDAGHHRLEWQGVSDSNAKHKTFWVDECTPDVEATSAPTVAPTTEPTPSPTAAPTTSPSAEPTASPSPSPTSTPSLEAIVPPTPSPTPSTEAIVPPTPSPTPSTEAIVPPTPSPSEPEGGQAPGEGSPPPGSSQAPDPAPADPSGSPEGAENAVVGGPIVDELPDTALDQPVLPGLGIVLGLLLLVACHAAVHARSASEDREA